jgi:hypothetical protein
MLERGTDTPEVFIKVLIFCQYRSSYDIFSSHILQLNVLLIVEWQNAWVLRVEIKKWSINTSMGDRPVLASISRCMHEPVPCVRAAC